MEPGTIAAQLDREQNPYRRMSLLFAWLEAFFNANTSTHLRSRDWRQAEKVFTELREKVGDGPVIKAAIESWLRWSIATAAVLATRNNLRSDDKVAAFHFIKDADDRERCAPLDLATYDRWLEGAHIPIDKLTELRRAYWRLILSIATLVDTEEAQELYAYVRERMARAYTSNEEHYRTTCEEFGLDPGDAWNKPALELRYL